MFFKFNSAFLLIFNFFLDPWKNKNDTFLIVKITFTKLRLLGVKCFFIFFIFNNTLPVNDWGEAVGQGRDLWSKPCTHCFTIVAFFGHCERPWKWVLQGSVMVFLSTSTGIAKFFTKKLLAWEQRAKKSISSTILCQ